MSRYIFSIYDKEAERFMEPFFITHDEEDKACKIAMRSISSQDVSSIVVPVVDLSLYLLGHIDTFGSLVGDKPILITEVADLFPALKEKANKVFEDYLKYKEEDNEDS